MMELVEAPSGRYHATNYLGGWGPVVRPDGLTPDKAEQLREIVMADIDDRGFRQGIGLYRKL